MSDRVPRVTIRLTRDRLLFALWVAIAAATWVSLAGEVRQVERPTTVSYVVYVWRDAGGGSYLLIDPDNMERDGTTEVYPFLLRNGYRLNICTPTGDDICGTITVGGKQVTLTFAGMETRTRPSTEVVTQPAYELTDLLVLSASTATFLTLALAVLWAAIAWIRRNVRVVR